MYVEGLLRTAARKPVGSQLLDSVRKVETPGGKQLHRMPCTATLFAFLLKGSEDCPWLSRSVR
eukprot:SAG22_NODE_20308_length_266_cov_1.550898_1_plen_62_part_10